MSILSTGVISLPFLIPPWRIKTRTSYIFTSFKVGIGLDRAAYDGCDVCRDSLLFVTRYSILSDSRRRHIDTSFDVRYSVLGTRYSPLGDGTRSSVTDGTPYFDTR